MERPSSGSYNQILQRQLGASDTSFEKYLNYVAINLKTILNEEDLSTSESKFLRL